MAIVKPSKQISTAIGGRTVGVERVLVGPEVIAHPRGRAWTAGDAVGMWRAGPPPGPSDAIDRSRLAMRVPLLMRLARLTPREETVLRARFGIGGDDERSQTDIADDLDVSKHRVSQIEKRALWKMRHPATAKYLAEFVDPRQYHEALHGENDRRRARLAQWNTEAAQGAAEQTRRQAEWNAMRAARNLAETKRRMAGAAPRPKVLVIAWRVVGFVGHVSVFPLTECLGVMRRVRAAVAWRARRGSAVPDRMALVEWRA